MSGTKMKRQGIQFRSVVHRTYADGSSRYEGKPPISREVYLYIEGIEKPVAHKRFDGMGHGWTDNMVDRVFQGWIRSRNHETVARKLEDPSHRKMVRAAHRERVAGTDGSLCRYRFGYAPDFQRPSRNGDGNLSFVLYEDEAERQETIKWREELAELERARARAQDELEERKLAHAPLINEAAKSALASKTLPTEKGAELFDAGVLDVSTSFRGGSLFPGEHYIIEFHFDEEGVEYVGRLGFDTELNLISIEGWSPERLEVYQGKEREPSGP